jgi:hypothetical protein
VKTFAQEPRGASVAILMVVVARAGPAQATAKAAISNSKRNFLDTAAPCAAASVAAECVMLNKGPFVDEAVRVLSGILRRQEPPLNNGRPRLTIGSQATRPSEANVVKRHPANVVYGLMGAVHALLAELPAHRGGRPRLTGAGAVAAATVA